MQGAITRTAKLDLHPSWTAVELSSRVEALLNKLAAVYGVKGVVPGHIKALVSEDGQYALFSCTRSGHVSQKVSDQWSGTALHHPQLNLNVVLVNNLPEERVEDGVDAILQDIFGPLHFDGHCDHDHEHE